MFGHDSLPTRVYSFGCKAPTIGAEAAREQIYLAHRYQNDLIAIERDRRAVVREALPRLCPDLPPLQAATTAIEARLAEAREAISRENSKSRSRSATPEQRKAIAAIRAELKVSRSELKARRKTAYAELPVVEALERIDDAAHVRCLAARKACGVYYGTYIATEASVWQARKARVDPSFHRWDGNGKIGAQIQGGMSIDDVFAAEDSRLQVRILDPQSKRPHALARVRIASTPQRGPVWCEVRARLHRPLPPGSRVKWAYLVRRRVGPTDHWSVQFTVSRAAGFEKTDLAGPGPGGAKPPIVAIDVGWRSVPEGLRVARWAAEDGGAGELIIPARRIEQWRKCESLRSIRDVDFNAIMPGFLAWIKSAARPEWMALATEHAPKWRSAGRLARLTVEWRDKRFDGDVEMFARCEAWRKQDKHLWLWESHQRLRASRWRREHYRLFAVMLRRTFGAAVIENTDWTKLARTPKPESEDKIIAAARWNQRIASVGLLSAIISGSGIKVMRVEAKNTTRECHGCGHVEAFDAAAAIHHVCSQCGRLWDQDENAARVMLARALMV